MKEKEIGKKEFFRGFNILFSFFLFLDEKISLYSLKMEKLRVIPANV